MSNTRTLSEKQNRLSFLIENELEKAELVLAVKSVTDKLQAMAENLVKIEANDLMPMLNSLKVAFGNQVAEQFSTTTTAHLRELVEAVRKAIDSIGNETLRLENAVNGTPSNDMAMPEPSEDMSTDMDTDVDTDPEMDADMEMPEPEMDEKPATNFAGRMRKESVTSKGKRLVEFASADIDNKLNTLSVFDQRAGSMGFNIEMLIDAGRYDGAERAALMNVLCHLAGCADDHRHWEDPDAKVEIALKNSKLDLRVPETREIASKLKKLAHLISLKHDGLMEGKRKHSISETKSIDSLVLKEFRSYLNKTGDVKRSVQKVAEHFSIDASDVIYIVREAKKTKIVENKKKSLSKKVVREAPYEDKFDDMTHWYDIIDSDTKKIVAKDVTPNPARASRIAKSYKSGEPLAEDVPTGSQSPADMRATQDAAKAQQSAQVAQSQKTTSNAAPASGAPKAPVAPVAPTANTSQAPTPAPVPGASTAPTAPTAPVAKRPSMAPGASSQKPTMAPGQTPTMESPMPGKVISTTPNVAIGPVTMMSKAKPFPMPQSELMASGNKVTESKKSR